MRTRTVILAGVGLLFGFSGVTQQTASRIKATPLILEKNEGEQRVRRPRDLPMASAAFMLKTDHKNGDSQHFVAGTEDMPPGAVIPRHKHLGQDEILVIQTGVAHIWLGEQERDVHAGALIFIPSETWISLRNIGNEVLSLVFIFSAPGFDEYLRCTSVPAGEQAPRLTNVEFQECQHKGHAIFQAKCSGYN